MVTSLSDGNLVLLRPGSHGGLTVTEKWHAHDHEPWIAAWNYWDGNVIFSGKAPPLYVFLVR
jgi:diphthine methyl ester acylhydrolase